jgi:hypothetical protein
MADSTRRPLPLRLKTARATRWLAVVGVAVALVATPAIAQSWWPFGGDSDEEEERAPPTPREPVYRQPPPQQMPPPGQQPAPTGNWATKNPVCLQLEQRLVQEGQRGGQAQQQLPALENELRTADRTYQQARSELERRDCYEYFLFSKSLRRTRQCVDLSNQMEGARRRVADLEAQRQQLTSSAGRSNQDEIIRELARNNCGSNYTQEARRREGGGTSFWEDEESTPSAHGNWGNYGNQSFATYRTLCVRLCDGYYFPVSFSTLPSHFEQDENVCQSKCAAPAELYYHQNPGGNVDQMVSARTQEPYKSLKSAFRYRKEYVQGCSCKQAEYVPDPAAGADNKRAETLPWSGTVKPQ